MLSRSSPIPEEHDGDGGHPLLFIEVPEGKDVKNRIRLDLRPAAGSREEELDRLLALGARDVEDRRTLDGAGAGAVGGTS